MIDIKQKLVSAARREAIKQTSEYVDMGHFRKPEEATPYLVDGFNQGHHSLHDSIIELVEALEKLKRANDRNAYDGYKFSRVDLTAIAEQSLAKFYAALEKE